MFENMLFTYKLLRQNALITQIIQIFLINDSLLRAVACGLFCLLIPTKEGVSIIVSFEKFTLFTTCSRSCFVIVNFALQNLVTSFSSSMHHLRVKGDWRFHQIFSSIPKRELL